jgi:hypothetical protein
MIFYHNNNHIFKMLKYDIPVEKAGTSKKRRYRNDDPGTI